MVCYSSFASVTKMFLLRLSQFQNSFTLQSARTQNYTLVYVNHRGGQKARQHATETHKTSDVGSRFTVMTETF